MIAPQQLGTFQPLDHIAVVSTDHRRVRLQDWTTTTTTTISTSDNYDDATIHTATTTTVDYTTAWNVQKHLLQQHFHRLQGQKTTTGTTLDEEQQHVSSFLRDGDNNNGVDTVIFLEHDPVYTLGTGSDPSFVKQQQPSDTTTTTVVPVIRMDRGGEVTYHGPGQLTIYPILDLRSYQQDIHWYVRALEEVVIVALQECGIDNAIRQEDVTGVWIDNYKVAAIGVSCKKWITQHGIAINVTPECLANFDGIVPCGLVGRQVGCINQFLPPQQQITVHQMSIYVKSAMEDVFRIRLIS